MDQPIVTVSPHQVFIWENDFKPTSHPVKILDTLFPVYKKNNGGHQKTTSILYTEDLLNWTNKNRLIWGWTILAISFLCLLRWMNLSANYIWTIVVVWAHNQG